MQRSTMGSTAVKAAVLAGWRAAALRPKLRLYVSPSITTGTMTVHCSAHQSCCNARRRLEATEFRKEQREGRSSSVAFPIGLFVEFAQPCR